jgi:hypothetical protein
MLTVKQQVEAGVESIKGSRKNIKLFLTNLTPMLQKSEGFRAKAPRVPP